MLKFGEVHLKQLDAALEDPKADPIIGANFYDRVRLLSTWRITRMTRSGLPLPTNWRLLTVIGTSCRTKVRCNLGIWPLTVSPSTTTEAFYRRASFDGKSYRQNASTDSRAAMRRAISIGLRSDGRTLEGRRWPEVGLLARRSWLGRMRD